MKNKYCDISNLRNEADVEQNFMRRLLEDLGYSDKEIRPKNSLSKLVVGGMRGRPQERYRPDFGLFVKGKARWIVEAKGPDEGLDKHEWQPRAYCVLLNGMDKNDKPVRYYLLSNGRKTRLYDPDLNEHVLALDFSDFVEGNFKFKQLQDTLTRTSILVKPAKKNGKTIILRKMPLSEVNAAFAWCHQKIYKMDDLSQSTAFSEFVKLIALKLISDRRVQASHPQIINQDSIELPIEEIDFCLYWIEKNERNSDNPINDILFRRFINDLEKEIAVGKRKQIFEAIDQIGLKAETIRAVVEHLENIFLFGIDADLNGRLFETFLNATMRGKDLGQFFTPRSLVKLGVRLANLQVNIVDKNGKYRSDRIIDACCGSGGFLIDALSDMWDKIDRKKNLSESEKAKLKDMLANNNIVGVDVANAPKLARIARLNMYLHGDGGTRIFHLNALDKEIVSSKNDSIEIAKEKNELGELLSDHGFDVALTNPPFAKALERGTDEEIRILDGYEIGRNDDGSPRASVRSALLFIERYYNLLCPGGRLITIIDDGILSGDKYKWFRDKLREWFLLRAVVSLPGDAFQRSNARVKTSYLIAEKRDPKTFQDQPPVFMYPCQYIGIDDPKRQRARHGDAEARASAEKEIQIVSSEYEKFLNGENTNYVVEAEKIKDRLDVKNCLMSTGRRTKIWRKQGLRILPLSDVLNERAYTDDEIITKDESELVRLIVVRYGGQVEAGEEIFPAESSYAKLYPVYAGDVIISNIAAHYGSIAVIPEELDGCVVSSEYTVLTTNKGFDPTIVQLILRSPEIRADILLSSSGANRTRASWEAMRDIKVPYPESDLEEKAINLSQDAEEAFHRALKSQKMAVEQIENNLLLRSDGAETILAAFKPPK